MTFSGWQKDQDPFEAWCFLIQMQIIKIMYKYFIAWYTTWRCIWMAVVILFFSSIKQKNIKLLYILFSNYLSFKMHTGKKLQGKKFFIFIWGDDYCSVIEVSLCWFCDVFFKLCASTRWNKNWRKRQWSLYYRNSFLPISYVSFANIIFTIPNNA